MSRFVRNFEALDATEPYDVCIVGTGIAGAVLGLRLVRAGLKVLMIESAASTDGASELFTPTHETLGDTHYPLAAEPRRIGGGSHAWRGICERLEQSDFRVHPYNRLSNPWPINYADLEPHYRAAERTLRVREAPTRGTRRVPRSERKRADPAFEALLRRHGIDVKGVAVATPGRGSPRFTMSRELLPEFIAARTGTLASGVTATRLRTDGNGRVIGAVCRTIDGVSKTARAQAYVVAAGALDTPRLLLLSRSQRFPRGLGNDFDRVGRGFNDQASITAYGCTPKLGGWPPSAAWLHTDQFHHVFRRDGLGAVHPFFERLGPLQYLRQARGHGLRKLVADTSAGRDAVLAIACSIETLPADCNRVTLSGTSVDVFGDPRARLIFDYSAEDLELIARTRAWLERWLDRLGGTATGQSEISWSGSMNGTCRMGANPRTSVCDPNLRIHASPNLYLCGAEVFPRGGAVPPALTIAALAHRLADHVAARARWCARSSARPKRSIVAAATAVPIPLVRRRREP